MPAFETTWHRQRKSEQSTPNYVIQVRLHGWRLILNYLFRIFSKQHRFLAGLPDREGSHLENEVVGIKNKIENRMRGHGAGRSIKGELSARTFQTGLSRTRVPG